MVRGERREKGGREKGRGEGRRVESDIILSLSGKRRRKGGREDGEV